MNITQMDQMSSFGGNSGNLTPNISSTRILKESPSTENEPQQHESSQESVDDANHPPVMVKFFKITVF